MVLGTATQRRTFLTSEWFFDNNVFEQVEDYTYFIIIIIIIIKLYLNTVLFH